MRMAEPSQVYATTGDAIAIFALNGASSGTPEVRLEDSGGRCVVIDPRDPRRVYVGTFDNGVLISADGGESWRSAGPGLAERRALSLAVSPSHQESGISIVYAGTEPSNLHRSQAGGQSWQLLPALRELPSEPKWSFPPRPWTHHVRTIALHPTDSNWLAVGIELGGVTRSRDGGASWA